MCLRYPGCGQNQNRSKRLRSRKRSPTELRPDHSNSEISVVVDNLRFHADAFTSKIGMNVPRRARKRFKMFPNHKGSRPAEGVKFHTSWVSGPIHLTRPIIETSISKRHTRCLPNGFYEGAGNVRKATADKSARVDERFPASELRLSE